MKWLKLLLQALLTPPVDPHNPPDRTVAERTLKIDEEGWLIGDNVKKMPAHTSWYYGLDSPDDQPIAIIWHYTATDPGTAKNMAKRRVRKRNPKKDRAASWHVTVATDGTLWQSVPFTKGAWHCGKGRIDGYRINKCTVGIELEGHGKSFPCAQVDAAEDLTAALAERYDITEANCRHGHSKFDPKRRSDPGSVWEQNCLPKLLQKAFRRCK